MWSEWVKTESGQFWSQHAVKSDIETILLIAVWNKLASMTFEPRYEIYAGRGDRHTKYKLTWIWVVVTEK